MTVSAYTGPNISTANGVSVVFPYNFKILAASDLLVSVDGLVRTLGTHYTVTGVGNAGGGNVVFITPPASGLTVARKRQMPYIRNTNYLNLGDLLAATLNDDQDAPVMMLQQLAADSMQLVPDPDSGQFAWDAGGWRIIRVGDAILATDAANMGMVWSYVEQVLGGGSSVGVSPREWSWVGNGLDTDFPMPGADVSDPLFYDTSAESAPNSGDYLVLRPGIDFTVLTELDPELSMIRFAIPPAAGQKGFTVLRGYARPYNGPAPVTSLAMNVVTGINANTTLGPAYQNALIVITSAVDITLTIRANSGGGATWKAGEFFSVMQLGTGKIRLAIEAGGTLDVPADFQAETRGQRCVISATCRGADSDSWVAAGDLLRNVAGPDLQYVAIEDRSVLIGTNIATGASKATFVMPYGLKLRAVANAGCYAGLAVAQAAGTVLTVDVNRNGVSILSTRLTFDNTEKTTLTAAIPPVYVDGGDMLYAGDEISIDVDQIGTALAKGLTVYLVGERIS